MTSEEYTLEENIKKWNILATLFFGVLVVLGFCYLQRTSGLPSSISMFDFFILVLAAFRLSRLLAYDNVTLFLREAFLDVKKVSYAEGGQDTIQRVHSVNSFKRTLDKLFNCPWCLGVWLSLFVVFFYFAFPTLWLFFLVLAVAGAGSLLQVFTNLLGWSAERKKQEAQHTDTI